MISITAHKNEFLILFNSNHFISCLTFVFSFSVYIFSLCYVYCINFDFLSFAIKLLSGGNFILPEINITPTAILYNMNSNNVIDRSASFVTAKSRKELDDLIYE